MHINKEVFQKEIVFRFQIAYCCGGMRMKSHLRRIIDYRLLF